MQGSHLQEKTGSVSGRQEITGSNPRKTTPTNFRPNKIHTELFSFEIKVNMIDIGIINAGWRIRVKLTRIRIRPSRIFKIRLRDIPESGSATMSEREIKEDRAHLGLR